MRSLRIPAFEYDVCQYVCGAFILIFDTLHFTLAILL